MNYSEKFIFIPAQKFTISCHSGNERSKISKFLVVIPSLQQQIDGLYLIGFPLYTLFCSPSLFSFLLCVTLCQHWEWPQKNTSYWLAGIQTVYWGILYVVSARAVSMTTEQTPFTEKAWWMCEAENFQHACKILML